MYGSYGVLGVVVQRPAEGVVGLVVVERWRKCMEESPVLVLLLRERLAMLHHVQVPGGHFLLINTLHVRCCS